MNERIKEILLQAEFEEQDGHISIQGVYMFNTTRMEKFAELLIEECANLCELRYVEHKDLSDESVEAMMCCNAIKEHFGVDE